MDYKVKAALTYFVSNALFRAKKIKLHENSTDKTRVAMNWDFSNSVSSCFLSNELGIKILLVTIFYTMLVSHYQIWSTGVFYSKRMVDKNRETAGIFFSLNDRNSNSIDDIIEYRSLTFLCSFSIF